MWLCTFLGRNGNKVYFFIEAPALVLCVWGWGGGRWGDGVVWVEIGGGMGLLFPRCCQAFGFHGAAPC